MYINPLQSLIKCKRYSIWNIRKGKSKENERKL